MITVTKIKLKSLKSSLPLYLIIFSVIPLIMITSFTLYNMLQSNKDTVLHKHQQILNQVKYEINNLINNVESSGEFTKENYPIEGHRLLVGMPKVKQHITAMLILDNNGILKDFSETVSSNIYKGYDFSNQSYFAPILQGKDKYWTEVYLSSTTQLPSISYIIRVDSNTIAVLVVDLSRLEYFSEKFKSLDNSSMLSIIDKNGLYVTNPDNKDSVSQRENIKTSNMYKSIMDKQNYNKQIIFYDNDIKYIGTYGITQKLKWTILVKEKYNYIFAKFNNILLFTILFVLILIILLVYFAQRLSKSILKPLDTLNESINKIASGKSPDENIKVYYNELAELAKNFVIMQKKIEEREKENRQKDRQLYDSIKMVQMGEMIGNIAHQWRQPLSVISTSASGLKMNHEFGLLKNEDIPKHMDAIVKSSQYLSETIDTFRDFIKEKKEIKSINLQKRIKDTLNIISATIKNNNIELKTNIDDIQEPIIINMVAGELDQVIINIINNAKDVLVEKHIENAWIKLELVEKNNKILITIEDNGGGIPSDILPKVFDPYFTTKHQSLGTGLGLHMSYQIITDSLHGKLYVNNTKNGAKFTIELSLF